MKNILLILVYLISINTHAENYLITKEKIIPIQEKKYVPKSIGLEHNSKAPLVSEEQCFQQAELQISSKFEPETDKIKYKGYYKHVKNLTEFTNNKGRGMTCRDSFIFYYIEFLNVIEKYVKSQVYVMDTMDKMVSNAEKMEQESIKKAEQRKLDKDYKNHPYKETWYDYENGIYEIRFVENKDENVREEIEKELAKMKYNPIKKCKFDLRKKYNDPLFFSKEFDTEYFIYDYNFEDFIGLIHAIVNKKAKFITIDAPLEEKFLLEINNIEENNRSIQELGYETVSFIQKGYLYKREETEIQRILHSLGGGNIYISYYEEDQPKYISLNYAFGGDYKELYINYLKNKNLELYNYAIIKGFYGKDYTKSKMGKIRFAGISINNKFIIYRSDCFGPNESIGS